MRALYIFFRIILSSVPITYPYPIQQQDEENAYKEYLSWSCGPTNTLRKLSKSFSSSKSNNKLIQLPIHKKHRENPYAYKGLFPVKDRTKHFPKNRNS